MQNNKYYLYARKSTDVEDKQVLSIEAQIVELQKFAADNNLYIVIQSLKRSPPKSPDDQSLAKCWGV